MRISLSIDPAGLEMLRDDIWTWYGKQKSLRDGILAVVVTGYADDWVVYVGPLSWSSLEVEQGGDKLSESAARQLFPWINMTGGYRR